MAGDSGSRGSSSHPTTCFYYTVERYQDVVVSITSRRAAQLVSDVALVEYTPMLFGSLFAKTPREEFSLLFDALNNRCETSLITNTYATVDHLIQRWGLEKIADSPFHELSGGYRKYVFIAAQVEARTRRERVVAINVQQQLDAARLRTVEARLSELHVKSVLWVDDDPNLLLTKSKAIPTRISLFEWLQLQEAPANASAGY